MLRATRGTPGAKLKRWKTGTANRTLAKQQEAKISMGPFHQMGTLSGSGSYTDSINGILDMAGSGDGKADWRGRIPRLIIFPFSS